MYSLFKDYAKHWLGGFAAPVAYLWHLVSDPFLNPSNRLYYLYLILFFLIALLVLRRQSRAAGEASWREVAHRALSPQVFAHPSAIQDYRYFLVYGALIGLAAQLLLQIISVVAVTRFVAAGLTAGLGPGAGQGFERLGVQATLSVGLFLASDLAFFLGHYLQHKVRWLWEFHKVHHSAEVLTPVTNFREHVMDSLVIGQISALLGGTVGGVFVYRYGAGVEPLTVSGLLALYWLFALTANFRHSHVWIAYGPRLSRVFSSPAMHQIHHSSEARHWDRNFGLALSVWDELFGCNYVPSQREKFRLGLSDRTEDDYRTVLQKLFLPFYRCIKPRVR